MSYDEMVLTEWDKVLFPEHALRKLPPLYANEHLAEQALCQIKYFSPITKWRWYASEFDGKDIFFGLVSGYELELGYFSLSELKDAKVALLLQRDRDFVPMTIAQVRKFEERYRAG